ATVESVKRSYRRRPNRMPAHQHALVPAEPATIANAIAQDDGSRGRRPELVATCDDNIEPSTDAPSTDAFPLLGYTVIATLQGVEVGHDELRDLLTPLGLARYLPALPEARTGLRRALRAWLHRLA